MTSNAATRSKPLTFDDLNTAENYDFIRTDPLYRNDAGEYPRRFIVAPIDENDPTEVSGELIVRGRHRIGFDPRTHKAWIKEGEVVIAPLSV